MCRVQNSLPKRRCTKVIRLPKRLRSAQVKVAGKRQKVLRGRRLRARLRLNPGRQVVRIVGRTKSGKRVRLKRRVRGC